MNPYDELNVEPDATPDEIKAAYRREAMDHHPDRKDGDHQKFQVVAMAYDTLKDPDKRARFDSTGSTDDPTPSENRLGQLLRVAVDQEDWGGNVVDNMRGHVQLAISQTGRASDIHRIEIRKIERRVGRIQGLPQVDVMLKSKIEHLNSVIAANDVEIVVLEGVLELLADATDPGSPETQFEWSALELP